MFSYDTNSSACFVFTSEDIKALVVGPIRVLMFICFSSSAHIVRHLKRVSGSFCKANKHIPYSPFHFIKTHLFSVIWMRLAHMEMDGHMNKVSNNGGEWAKSSSFSKPGQVIVISVHGSHADRSDLHGDALVKLLHHTLWCIKTGTNSMKSQNLHMWSLYDGLLKKQNNEDKSCLYDSACWDLKIQKLL